MRSKIWSLVLGLTIVTCLVLAGCGDDETTNSNLGSLTDPEFMVVQTEVASFVDSTLDFLGNGLNTLQGISTGDGSIIPAQYVVDPNGNDVLDVSYADGWHVIYMSKHYTDYATSLRDSVQFLNDGVAQQLPVSIDQLTFKHHWDYDVVDTTITHAVLAGNSSFDFQGLDLGTATINGANTLNIHTKLVTDDSTVWRDIIVEATVTDLTVANSAFSGWGQCPTSGTVTCDVDMVYYKDTDDPVVTSWTVTSTFSNGTMNVACASNGINWNYSSDVCTVPQ